MNRFWLYLPIPITLLFILLAFYIQPFIQVEQKAAFPSDIIGVLFIVIALLDMLLIYKKFLPEVISASSEMAVQQRGLLCVTTTDVPVILGFVHFFLYGSMLYFGILTIIGLLAWLFFYRKIESKLNEVGV